MQLSVIISRNYVVLVLRVSQISTLNLNPNLKSQIPNPNPQADPISQPYSTARTSHPSHTPYSPYPWAIPMPTCTYLLITPNLHCIVSYHYHIKSPSPCLPRHETKQPKEKKKQKQIKRAPENKQTHHPPLSFSFPLDRGEMRRGEIYIYIFFLSRIWMYVYAVWPLHIE